MAFGSEGTVKADRARGVRDSYCYQYQPDNRSELKIEGQLLLKRYNTIKINSPT